MGCMRKHRIIAGAAIMTSLTTILAGTAFAGSAPPGALPPLNPATLRAAMAGLPNSTVTGELVKISGPAGRWNGTSGVSDVQTKAPVDVNGNFRIGSISKIFTATVILKLVAGNRVDLNQTVQHYLPGLLPRKWPAITVGELLNHTSGLPGQSTLPNGDATWFAAHRFESWTPRQVVESYAGDQMAFTPGTKQEYNGLNYFLAGMIAQSVTGDSYASLVRRWIIAPLGLKHTSVPDRNDPYLPEPYSHGYIRTDHGLVDVSEQSPWPWAEGGLISDADDLATALRAMIGGKLLPPAETALLFQVPDVPYAGTSDCNIGPLAGHACYSEGLESATLPNGVVIWGKTGQRPGYTSGVFADRDLKRVTVYSMNPTGDSDGSEMPYVLKLAAAAFDPGL